MFDHSLENNCIYFMFLKDAAKSREMLVSASILLYRKMVDLYLSRNSHVTLRKDVFMTQVRFPESPTAISH